MQYGPPPILRRTSTAAWSVAAIAALVLVLTVVWPIDATISAGMGETETALPPPPSARDRLDDVKRHVAGKRLIRPALVQPAVRDDGQLRRLLERVKLSGIVHANGRYVAYLDIKDEGVVRVVEQSNVLGITVERIEPGRVILALGGVRAELSH